jgi:hypothetical protein
MIKLKSKFQYNKFKIIIIYFFTVAIASIVAASFRDDSVEAKDVQEEVLKAAQTGTDTLTVPDTTAADTILEEKKEEYLKLEKRIADYLLENKGLKFEDTSYTFTIDFQNNFLNRIVLFNIYVEDIFTENGKAYLKSKRVSSDINVFLKLECTNEQVEILKGINYFVNVAAEIKDVKKVFFFTKAQIAEAEEDPSAYITFDTVEEGVLMTGSCREILE